MSSYSITLSDDDDDINNNNNNNILTEGCNFCIDKKN